MVKYLFLILITFLLGSCAIQGSITGGPVDKKPPVFDTLRLKPSLGTIHFDAKEICLPFKEFITLNNASENIIIVPDDFKIEASAKDRVLTLRIKDQPKPNTTYAIYLNNAVKDLHEGNDTLLTYVFSTGDYIDSITYNGRSIDAQTRLPFKGATVALYSDTISTFFQKAVNFSLTNEKGEFTLKYIHPGNYYVIAYQDQNRDFIPQPHELVGFKTEKINLTKSVEDSSAIELFPPLRKKALRRVSHVNNQEIIVTGNIPIEKANIKLFNQQILDKKVHKADSISIFVNTNAIDTLRGSITIDKYVDTFYCRVQSKQNHKTPKLYFPASVRQNLLWEITTNDFITAFNKDSIQVFVNDSTEIPFELKASGYQIQVKPTHFLTKSYKLIVKSSGLTFTNFKEKFTLNQVLNVFDSTQYGIFNVVTSSFPPGTLLEVLSGEKVTHRCTVDEKNSIWKIDDLEKGAYFFKAYFDSNNNGRWDTGNLQNKIQPEKIKIYNEPFQARQNWEVEVKFDPAKWK